MNKKKSYMNLRNCIIEKVGPPNFSLGHHYSIVSGPVGHQAQNVSLYPC